MALFVRCSSIHKSGIVQLAPLQSCIEPQKLAIQDTFAVSMMRGFLKHLTTTWYECNMISGPGPSITRLAEDVLISTDPTYDDREVKVAE